VKLSYGPAEDLNRNREIKIRSVDFVSQKIALTTPPSTRSAAPLVAEESSLAT